MMYTYVAAWLLGLVMGLTGAWQVQEGRYASKEVARLEFEREAKKMREKTMYDASAAFEKDRTKLRTQYLYEVKTITEYIDRPVYKNVCIDEDGLKLINLGVKP